MKTIFIDDTRLKTTSLLAAAALLLPFAAAFAANAPETEEGFVGLFGGKTLEGWKIGKNANAFSVHDGVIVMDYPAGDQGPAHLFYDGPVGNHRFKNFILKVDVMTSPYANSGIYFHTEYQESEWPRKGLECQVDNSHSDWRRTGSLYGIKHITWGPEKPPVNTKEDIIRYDKAPVIDNVWYTQEVIYQDGSITVKLDGKAVIEYQMPEAGVEHKLRGGNTWLPRGTFCLQGHPPMDGKGSKACFKNIRVKILPD
jgi:hypothetical protein